MRKINPIIILLSLFYTSECVFANDMSSRLSENKPCIVVAQACKAAGFSQGKPFWFDCMKPVILGKMVKGVNVDQAVIKMCRTKKIDRMKKELGELEAVK